jgi:hypothetical protein
LLEKLSRKNPSQKRAGEMAQVIKMPDYHTRPWVQTPVPPKPTWRAGSGTQVVEYLLNKCVGPKFKPQYRQKKKKKEC